jgi:enamine deaminase RidA (YjgF/YER057c/UK114 family)
MKRSSLLVSALFSFCAAHLSYAQAASVGAPLPFNKENVYGVWSKDLFADASIVQGSYKTIYIAGMAAEDPTTGKIAHLDDFSGQCKMAYDKIRKVLKAQGGDMSDIVNMTTYITDIRNVKAYLACEKEALGTAPLPPNTLLDVSQLSWPGMMVEVQVTAVVPLKKTDP